MSLLVYNLMRTVLSPAQAAAPAARPAPRGPLTEGAPS